MRFSMRDAALDLDSVCCIERLRIEALEMQARQLFAAGYLENSPHTGFRGLRERLERLKRIAHFLHVAADHEPVIRALDPRLGIPAPDQAGTALSSPKG